MKKLFLGVFIGMMLMVPCVTLAFENSKHFISVKINGNETSKKAVDIEGTSYLSVEDVSQLFGYDFYINETDGEVDLVSKSGVQQKRETYSGEITITP